jgi:hypothetical protein
MTSHPRGPRLDADGVRVFEDVGVRRVVRVFAVTAVLVTLATVAIVFVLRATPAARPPVVPAPAPVASRDAAPTAGRPVPAAAPGAAPAARPARLRRRDVAAPPATATPPASPPDLDASDVILALRARGETGGIAAFGLPGTDPIKPGIVVPDDFELPPGYVRHHQVTDDGRELPPILMFHPDYEIVDDAGQPVPLPANRVVPPDLAPPGLPIRMLDVPASPDASGARR